MSAVVETLHGAGGYVAEISLLHEPRGPRYRYTIRKQRGEWCGGGTGDRSLEDTREPVRDDLSALWLTGGRP